MLDIGINDISKALSRGLLKIVANIYEGAFLFLQKSSLIDVCHNFLSSSSKTPLVFSECGFTLKRVRVMART